MTTIGYATLQIIPALRGVTEAIDQQIDGKVVNVSITPKVDQKAADTAGKQVKDTIEKQTTDVAVKPKVDQPAAETAGKQAKETVEKHTGDVKVTPKIESAAMVSAGAEAGERAGRAIGEQIAKTIPAGMPGIAGSVGNILRSALPGLGSIVGAGTGAAIVTAILDKVSKGNYTKAGESIKHSLVGAVDKANVGTDIAIRLGNSVSGGLSKASDKITAVTGSITGRISEVGNALTTTKELIGGDDAWGAGAIDTLNNALGTATPLLEGMNAAAVLASAGANAIALGTKAAAAAQRLWNLAMTANPIGLVVTAIAALAAGIIYAYNHSETFRKIVDAAWAAIKVAAEAVVKWFMDTAWPLLKRVWEGIGDGWSWLVTKAGEVWTGVKEKFTAIVDFVKGMPSAITNAAKGMWDGLKNGLVTVLNWIGDKWNAVADTLSIEVGGTKISAIPHMPKFDGGGYTGNVSAQQIAGVVHGDEFVIKSKSRKGIENAYPGLLDYLNNQGKLPGYAGGGLVAGTAQLRKIISERFGISNIGGWRPADKYGEHSTGRALDVMTSDKAKGDAVKDFAVDNASAIDLKWAIWQQKLWYPGGSSQKMDNRGSPTQNHMDHVHIFSGPGITNGLLGSLKSKGGDTGQGVAAGVNPPVGDTMVSSGGTEAVSPAAPGGGTSSTGGGGFTLPSSIPGLSGLGLAGMGVKSQMPGQPERTFEFGNAAAAAVGGQVSSALGVLGVPDSPGWLKGISQFVSGISIGGGGSGGGLGGAPEGAGPGARFGGATPIAASAAVPAPAALPAGSAHGAQAGARPGPVFNTTISAFNTSDAVSIMRQQQDEMAAAKLGRWS